MPFDVGATLVIIGLSASAAQAADAPGAAPAPAAPPAAAPTPGAPAAAGKPAAAPATAAKSKSDKKSDGNANAPAAGSASAPNAPAGGAPAGAVAAAPAAPAAVAPEAAPSAATAAQSPASEASAGGTAPSPAATPGLTPVPNSDLAAALSAQPAPSAAPTAQAPEPPPAAPPPGAPPVPVQSGVPGGAVTADRAEAARVQPANALPPGQILVPSGFSIAVSSQMSFGQSTFQTGGGYARDPMVDWSLSLSPGYFFGDGTRLAASASISQELTQSDSDDDPQTIIMSDIGLSASRSLYHFEHGPQIFGSLNMQLPTSKSSQVETLVTSLGARLSASQPIGGVFLSLGTGFRKNFHRYTHPTRNPNTGDELVTRDGLVVEDVVTGIARTGGSELAGATYFDGESNNTSMVWSNSISAFWPVSDKIGLGLSYNLSHSWTYESYPVDELSGVGAKDGRGRRDSHGGSIFANYQALDQLAFGLGMATGGPTRTADDKRIRFPFYNFDGAESNMTTFFISATYTESISL